MAKPWDDYLSEVLPDVKGCPKGYAIEAVRDAAIRLCDKSKIWRQTLDSLNSVVGIPDYKLDLPSDSEIILIRWVKYNGTTILPKTEDELDSENKNFRVDNWRDATGEPYHYFLDEQDNIYLYPIPDTAIANSIIVGVTLKPKIDSFEGPDYLYYKWRNVIACGAKAKLMSMRTRSWYAPAEAAKESIDFSNGISEARIRANKSGTQTSQRIKMRPIA